MDNQPAFDRGLILPALIGIFSVVGICLVLLVYRYNTSRVVIEVTVTHTPFKYIFLGTEPALSTEPSPEESVTETVDEDSPPIVTQPTLSFTQDSPIILTPNTPQITTPNTPAPSLLTPSNSTATLASAAPPPLNPGTYDDVYPGLIYSGNWVPLTNVSGAHDNTLHRSDALTNPGNSVTFRYIGQEVRLFYQSGPSLGVARILLDGTQTLLDQSNTSNELVLSAVQAGTHTVTITHQSGGSINLDYVVVPLGLTPSPSATATVTATSTP
ncbi:MAG TPA: hypothetical protein VJM08_12490 [Anaerolineales bacterium]|nr:hypothetical protein [Anaerolineales bacterium]